MEIPLLRERLGTGLSEHKFQSSVLAFSSGLRQSRLMNGTGSQERSWASSILRTGSTFLWSKYFSAFVLRHELSHANSGMSCSICAHSCRQSLLARILVGLSAAAVDRMLSWEPGLAIPTSATAASPCVRHLPRFPHLSNGVHGTWPPSPSAWSLKAQGYYGAC